MTSPRQLCQEVCKFCNHTVHADQRTQTFPGTAKVLEAGHSLTGGVFIHELRGFISAFAKLTQNERVLPFQRIASVQFHRCSSRQPIVSPAITCHYHSLANFNFQEIGREVVHDHSPYSNGHDTPESCQLQLGTAYCKQV